MCHSFNIDMFWQYLRLLFGCVFTSKPTGGAVFHATAALLFGWIISSIIPRMQSETPKPQQQQQPRAFQVIMAIRDTSSHWIPHSNKGCLPPLHEYKHRVSCSEETCRIFSPHWREDIASDRHGSVGAVHKGKTSVHLCVYSWVLAYRLKKCPSRRFSVMLKINVHFQDIPSINMLTVCFFLRGKKNPFNSKPGAGFKWMTAMLKPHKTCWPDTRCDAFMCLNIDVSAEMGAADLETDAAQSRFFSQQCSFFHTRNYNIHN